MAWRSTPLVPSTAPSGRPRRFEDRALFDVEFEIGGGVFALYGGFGKAVDFDAAVAQGVFEANAVAIGAAAVGVDRVSAGEGGGAEQTAAEARAFFIGPVDEADGDGRAAVVFARRSGGGFRGR